MVGVVAGANSSQEVVVFVVLRVRFFVFFTLLFTLHGSPRLVHGTKPELIPHHWCAGSVAFAKRLRPTWMSRFSVPGDKVLGEAMGAVRPSSFFQFQIVRHQLTLPAYYEARTGVLFGPEHGNLSFFLPSLTEGEPVFLTTGGVEPFSPGPRAAYDQLSAQFQRDVIPHLLPVQIQRVRDDVSRNLTLSWSELTRTLEVFAAAGRGYSLRMDFRYDLSLPWRTEKHVYFESKVKQDGTYASQVRLRVKSPQEAEDFLKLLNRWMGGTKDAVPTKFALERADHIRYATSKGLWADLFTIPQATEEDDFSDLVPGAPEVEGEFLLDLFPAGDENWNKPMTDEEFKRLYSFTLNGERGGISLVQGAGRANVLHNLVETIFTNARLAEHEMLPAISSSSDGAETPAAGPASTQSPGPSPSDLAQ